MAESGREHEPTAVCPSLHAGPSRQARKACVTTLRERFAVDFPWSLFSLGQCLDEPVGIGEDESLSSAAVCLHRTEVGKKQLGISRELFSKAARRVSCKRIDATVDLGKVEVPDLLGFAVAGSWGLRNDLKDAAAVYVALAVVDHPAAGANHPVNDGAPEIVEGYASQHVALFAPDGLIPVCRSRHSNRQGCVGLRHAARRSDVKTRSSIVR